MNVTNTHTNSKSPSPWKKTNQGKQKIHCFFFDIVLATVTFSLHSIMSYHLKHLNQVEGITLILKGLYPPP